MPASPGHRTTGAPKCRLPACPQPAWITKPSCTDKPHRMLLAQQNLPLVHSPRRSRASKRPAIGWYRVRSIVVAVCGAAFIMANHSPEDACRMRPCTRMSRAAPATAQARRSGRERCTPHRQDTASVDIRNSAGLMASLDMAHRIGCAARIRHSGTTIPRGSRHERPSRQPAGGYRSRSTGVLRSTWVRRCT